MNGDDACTMTFITNLNNCDECCTAVKIYLCEGNEAKQIPIEYIELFGGDDSIHIYNELV